MNLDQIVHNRVAHMLGDALIRRATFEAEAELLRREVSELKDKLKGAPVEPSAPDTPA